MRNDYLPHRMGTCYHGGAFWDVIGDELTHLERRDEVIAADVLDAWFDPAPGVIDAVAACLPFALRASPPTNARGMERVIARHRAIGPDSVLAGAGSSDLIFAGLRHFVSASSRVLILDPMYGEYAHVLERVIGARVDRLDLDRGGDYDLRPDALRAKLAGGYDWVIIVNPNSPTGRYTDGAAIMELAGSAAGTRFWIDETYIDYVDPALTVEALAAASTNAIVCKSMSKAYALSGARAAYLAGPPALIAELRGIAPPWSVSLPAQIAACEALAAIDYYGARWRETGALRAALQRGLTGIGIGVVPGCANFLLCELPPDGPPAAIIAAMARERGLLIRNVANMGHRFGPGAFRIAVRDAATNARMIDILAESIAVHTLLPGLARAWTT